MSKPPTQSKENKLRFVSLEVKGVKEMFEECQVVEDDADADFFSIYGRDENNLAHCIGDFSTRQGAEVIRAAIESG
jgi:hypothetical protein